MPADTRGSCPSSILPIQVQLFKQYVKYAIVNVIKLITVAFIFSFDEACFTDYLVETPRYPKEPLQKKSSVPFGSKAGMLTTLNLMQQS